MQIRLFLSYFCAAVFSAVISALPANAMDAGPTCSNVFGEIAVRKQLKAAAAEAKAKGAAPDAAVAAAKATTAPEPAPLARIPGHGSGNPLLDIGAPRPHGGFNSLPSAAEELAKSPLGRDLADNRKLLASLAPPASLPALAPERVAKAVPPEPSQLRLSAVTTDGRFPTAERIGMYPGSFDPPLWETHRQLLILAKKEQNLDVVLVEIPPNSARKLDATPRAIREEMARAMFADLPWVKFASPELETTMGKAVHAEWVDHVAQLNPKAKVWSISGVDVLEEANEFRPFRSPNASHLIATREGSVRGDELRTLAAKKGIDGHYASFDGVPGGSSTKIRKEIEAGNLENVHPRLREIVEREKLYRPEGNLNTARTRLAEVEAELAAKPASKAAADDLAKQKRYFENSIQKNEQLVAQPNAGGLRLSAVAENTPVPPEKQALNYGAMSPAEMGREIAKAQGELDAAARDLLEVAAADTNHLQRLRDGGRKGEVSSAMQESNKLLEAARSTMVEKAALIKYLKEEKLLAEAESAAKIAVAARAPSNVPGGSSLIRPEQVMSMRQVVANKGSTAPVFDAMVNSYIKRATSNNDKFHRLSKELGISPSELQSRAFRCMKR